MVLANYPATEPVLTYWFKNQPGKGNYIKKVETAIHRTRGEPYILKISTEHFSRVRGSAATSRNAGQKFGNSGHRQIFRSATGGKRTRKRRRKHRKIKKTKRRRRKKSRKSRKH